MSKNLVVCCDGTGDEYGDQKTNVLKLHSVLVHDPASQICFYDPGVGTFPIHDTVTRPARSLQLAAGLAFGLGFRENVQEAYRFVAENYQPGDRIYLFGFSRGAYCARVVAALIRAVGLLPASQENLIPYALRYLEMKRGRTDWRRLNGFRRQFSEFPSVGFLFVGVWDTVSSVSWAWDHLVYTATASNRAVNVFRHAVAIDERRAFFRTNLWSPVADQDAKEVWFAGVHCDVGGSYAEEQSGLSKITLEWMMVEARRHGLLLDNVQAQKLLDAPQRPEATGLIHRSLKGLWWLMEIVPKRPYVRGRRRLRFNLGRRRFIPPRPRVHASVVYRQRELDYRPPNLPAEFDVEEWVSLDSRKVAQPEDQVVESGKLG